MALRRRMSRRRRTTEKFVAAAPARSDALVAEALARAALAGAVENVRVNVGSLSEPGLGRSLLEEAEGLARTISPSS